ncbi:MAG: BON domain-containing protein [Pirellulaceae bacterium]
MSEKKPTPTLTRSASRECPVCGKVSYSLGGVHPQCNVARADAASQAARKAQLKKEPAVPPRDRWSKRCPHCSRQVPARRLVCDCGKQFAPTTGSGGVAAAGPRPALSSPALSSAVPSVPARPPESNRKMSGATDKAITVQVNQRLANRGVRSPCRVAVATKGGDVTLSGSVQFAHQKAASSQAASSISGVRRVINNLSVKPIAKRT